MAEAPEAFLAVIGADAAGADAAAFSAIMIVGALVFPLTSQGITDASTTISPSTPFTARPMSHTASASGPIRQVPTG